MTAHRDSVIKVAGVDYFRLPHLSAEMDAVIQTQAKGLSSVKMSPVGLYLARTIFLIR
jgi:hypothetical protein